MPGIQESIALLIVALVAGRLLWRRWVRRAAPGHSGPGQSGKSGDCHDCVAAAPPPKEATVHFYRRRTPEGSDPHAADPSAGDP